ncbi:hypothetical protein BOTBODRAFT_185297 [Botryobasidium botryosum FD-172 SS1]|uniref:Uncharacterized protein n=1 Tax=Botryobasidium botryosum (strain FD-172 SS1) TaxID=930990 RepID=A0A067N176_BOTB1|nr:hypothetical protein BOTBODRAFT_185297 [Botryobasidium botryosum FD-172 SS1]
MLLEFVEDTHSDEDHARWDSSVDMEGKRPRLRYFLLDIIHGCEILDQKLVPTDLLNGPHGKELAELLEAAWTSKDVRRIRCLEILQNKELRTSRGPSNLVRFTTQHEADATAKAWEGPFQGDAAFDFRMALDNMNDKRGQKLYANFVSIIQSSGMGKSRLLDETAKAIFTIPFCLRPENSGYPPADVHPRRFFTLHTLDTYDNLRDRCLLFFERLFITITQALGKKPQSESDTPGWWYRYLKSGGARAALYEKTIEDTWDRLRDLNRLQHLPEKYSEMKGSTGEVTNPVGPEEISRAVFLAPQSLLEAVGKSPHSYPSQPVRPVRLLVYIDESQQMISEKQSLPDGRSVYQVLCTSLNALKGLDIFFVFMSTTSSLSHYAPAKRVFWSARGQDVKRSLAQTPYTELPFDDWGDRPLVEEGRHKMADIAETAFFVRFGRPLWWTLWEYGDATIRDEMVSFAKLKLSASQAADSGSVATLAALSVRLALEFEPRRIGAIEMENTLVAGHMRVANVIPKHLEYLISSAPSEPILAEVAAHILAGKKVPSELHKHVQDGLIRKGQHGELVGRLLVTLAHDSAVKEKHGRPYSPIQNEPLPRYFTEPISVCSFFEALLSKEHSDQILDMAPDDGVQPDRFFREVFKEAYISFTHFGKAADDWAASDAFMFIAFCRHMAVMASEEMKGVDFFIPYHIGLDEPISRRTCGVIMWSIKDTARTKSANETHVDVKQVYRRSQGNNNPVIVVVMELGVQAAAPYLHVGHTRKQSSSDLFGTPPKATTSSKSSSSLPNQRKRQKLEIESTRQDDGPLCYTIILRGCNSKVYRVIKEGDEAVYASLLASRTFLSEHGRQDKRYLSAILAQKPVWTLGEECTSWVKWSGKDEHPFPVVDK